MKEQFVPYEIALKLKKLSFNEECFAYYRNRELYRWQIGECQFFRDQTYWLNSDCEINENCGAPLWQQALNWFRIQHGLNLYLRINDEYDNDSYEWVIEGHSYILACCETECVENWTFEDARLSGINRLIEIISEK